MAANVAASVSRTHVAGRESSTQLCVGRRVLLPFRVHAPFNDRGFMEEEGPPYFEVFLLFGLFFMLVKSTIRLKRVVTGAGSADDE